MDVDLPNVLKRCLSAPIINNLPANSTLPTSKQNPSGDEMTSTTASATTSSASSSREASPAPILNIFAPRARRYSASYASLSGGGNGPRLTPRVSQLRQEECADANTREVNHEREVHSAMQMSQSWEDLTLVAENWSCKSEDLTNPLQVSLPTGPPSCSSPSPTSRAGMRLPYGLSPSPTRKIFTRRSMSPIAMRPSQLGPVKRKFELDDCNWTSTCSPPPFKKIFTESRGPSPICQSPSSICPSPDSGTYEGRLTPKLFVSKLYSNGTNSSSSICSSPMIPSPGVDSAIDLASNNSGSPAAMISSSASSEPMSVVSCCDNETESEMTDTESETRAKIGMDSDSETTTDSLREKKLIMDDVKMFEESSKNDENFKIVGNLSSEQLLAPTIVTPEKLIKSIMPASLNSTDSLSSFSDTNFRINRNDNDSGDNSISRNVESSESSSNYESELVSAVDAST